MKNLVLKLPGLVDVHVHLREPGGMQKEDFESGTKAAIAGGYTQILDMPNNIPPTITYKSLQDKIQRAKGRIWCDLGFNFGGSMSSIKYFNKIDKKSFGLKIYMNQTTGTLLIDKLKEREQLFKKWQSPLPIMVHAEGKSVEIAIKLARKYKKAVHICHITNDQLDPIKKAKEDGLPITCEVCPHHLYLNKSDINKLGPLGMMKPPLLTIRGQKQLWENLDMIDMISTDHAPHTLEEKYDITTPKFGVPGLETTLPLLLNAVHNKLITQERIIEMLCINPRRIFRLSKQANTHIEVDLSKVYKISNDLFTKCGWTPFKGLQGRGVVKKVVIRGKMVYKERQFQNKPQGQIIYPRNS